MIQICNEQYWKNCGKEITENDKPCGKIFNDLDQMTYCPHPYFPPGNHD